MEFELPNPAAMSPPGSCQEAWSPRMGLTPGRDGSRRRHVGASLFSPAVPPACHKERSLDD